MMSVYPPQDVDFVETSLQNTETSNRSVLKVRQKTEDWKAQQQKSSESDKQQANIIKSSWTHDDVDTW